MIVMIPNFCFGNPPSIFAFVTLLFRVIHDEIKEFSCGMCGYSTSRKRTLDKHMKQLHMENIPIPNGFEQVMAEEQDHSQTMKLEQVGPAEMRFNWSNVAVSQEHYVVQPLTNQDVRSNRELG